MHESIYLIYRLDTNVSHLVDPALFFFVGGAWGIFVYWAIHHSSSAKSNSAG
jgi:hypothetical protein